MPDRNSGVVRLLDTKQAAAELGLSVGYLATMRSKGSRCGPRYLKAGHRVLYRPADLEEWREVSRRG